MKALNCKTKILLVAFLLAGTGLFAQDVTKELHEEFTTDKSTVLNIDSKFCNLTVNNWDKDKAVIDVTMKVTNSDEAAAKKLLKQIMGDVEKNGNEIKIKTNLDDDFSKGLQKVTKRFSITIEVSVPSYINLELDSKFGTASFGSFSGDADIACSFGQIEIEKLSGSMISIELNQGDINIGEIANADVDLNFGKLTIIKAGNIMIEINQGDATIGNVKNLSAELSMGNLIIKHFDSSFETIDIEMNLGNVNLGVDKDAGFTLDAEMKNGNIDFPKELVLSKKSKSGMDLSFEGKYGNGKSSITLDGKLGNMELKLK